MQIILAKPRGFCAGVDRAIEIVEKAIDKHGAPVYVRHEIVHNKFVVDNLKSKGAIFVKEVDEVPDGELVIFSAHGVSDEVEQSARVRSLPVIDATCPLVTKVHKQARKSEKQGHKIILIGHAGHPEVEGTSGRVKQDVILVQNEKEAEEIEIEDSSNLAYVTQTTLSVNETKGVSKVGLTSGASAPEVLVEGVIEFIRNNFGNASVDIMKGLEENVLFPLPKELRG